MEIPNSLIKQTTEQGMNGFHLIAADDHIDVLFEANLDI
jgi:hypothetical protein